jgi:hypothetical protein
MELAPHLQFKHYTLRQVQLPADALVALEDIDFDTVEICCDLEKHVLNPEHTEPRVAEALRASHWFGLHEWANRHHGADAA